MKKLIIARRCSQILFLLLFVYILWSTTYPLRGLLSADISFKINPLVMIFTSISERIVLPGLIFAISMLALTLVLGRFFCGWVCPMGSVIDGIGALNKKKIILKDSANKKISLVKFVILGIILLFSLFGIQIAWIFDPVVTIARFVSLNLIPSLTFAIDKLFVIAIQRFELYGAFHDFYRGLKESILGVNIYYFANSVAIFIFFMVIVSFAILISRLWCRMFCPLGALYAFFGRFSLLRRVANECTYCGMCKDHCRTGAIKDSMKYRKGECVLCMDCVYDCIQNKTKFSFRREVNLLKKKSDDKNGISRRSFLFLMLSSVFFLGARGRSSRIGFRRKGRSDIIRPPGALKEEEFLDRCIRCGNCMKVCITNGLQPVMFEAGLSGIWTPQLVPEIGYCEYNCTLCMEVCPTGALQRLTLEEKKKYKLGLAKVNKLTCLAWSQKLECLVCEEHCPVSQKAIKLEEEWVKDRILIKKPYVDKNLCIGCGICQNKCPVRPMRAIRVYPEKKRS
ncbi:4Fe-4S binding protein [Thermoproteota archaeon]